MKKKNIMPFLLLFCTVTFSQVASNKISEGNILKIVAFGNSTTAYRKAIDQVFSERLPGMLMKIGIPAVVYNSGVGGSHTGRITDNNRHKVAHALDRFEDVVLDYCPDIVTICFGINDSFYDKGKDKPRIPRVKYKDNLSYMIEELQKREIDIILMTPNALGKKHSEKQYNTTAKYVKTMRKLSDKYQLPLIDQWEIFEEYASEDGKEIDDYLLDGTHPNNEWHAKWADLIKKEVMKILKNK